MPDTNGTLRSKSYARHILLAGIASLFTLLIYLPSLNHGFVNWDDFLIYDNPHIRAFGVDSIKWAFTSEFNGNWHPLTVITYGLEYSFWGAKPFGYILVNIILHALNTMLVFFLAVRLLQVARRAGKPASDADALQTGTGILAAGFIASLLFGIHPIHVESVAWISETKDLLCAFFFLLSAFFYIGYASGPSVLKKQYYLLSFVFALLAILSKPMAVTLPFVLLILDIYPCGRFNDAANRLRGFNPFKEVKKALIEKIPFLLISVLSAVLTLWAQSKVEAINITIGIVPRLGVAARGYAFYLYKLALPFNLAPVYPMPASNAEIFNFGLVVALLALFSVFCVCIFTFKRSAGFSAAWIYYAVTLAPVSGIMQVGSQGAADRYMYLPSVSLFILAGVLAGRIIETHDKRIKAVAAVFAVFVISSLSVLTVWQEGIWQSSLTLWSHQILLYPGKASLAYSNRAAEYFKLGDMKKALKDVNAAIDIDRKNAKAYNNRAAIFFQDGRLGEAFADMNKAIELNPKYAEAYLHRGIMYAARGELGLAVKDYTAAVALDPGEISAYYNRGQAYLALGDYARAIADYSAVAGAGPYVTVDVAKGAFNDRGIAFGQTGRYGEAVKDFDRAIELDPMFERAYSNRGRAHLKAGDYRLAALDFEKAASINPSNPAVYNSLGEAYSKLGRKDDARANFEKAASIKKGR
ncbi:MAG: tetratricopeptide repeat protein [Deltaproteobacteria bacterium]|nr:tetratricopeptide repeat protein [Deltaproteobacteria bacterium]